MSLCWPVEIAMTMFNQMVKRKQIDRISMSKKLKRKHVYFVMTP